MGLPSITITFTEKAKTAITRLDKGIVGLILKGNIPSVNPIVATTDEDIPNSLSAANQEYIKQTLLGNGRSPKKVVAYCIEESAEDYTEALAYFETNRINYLAVPTVETDLAMDSIKSWIKKERKEGRTVKAVLPKCEADDEGIINFATDNIVCGEKTYSTEAFCCRIAGVIAATEAKASCTYTALPDVDSVEKMTRAEMDDAIDKGKLLLFHDGEKVKIARGVNSLTTTGLGKGYQFKKIKNVETMDTIRDDITKTIEDVYIGKYPNTYDNKCLLISAISDYLSTLEQIQIIENQVVEIDVQAVKQYLKENGEDVSAMTDDEIKMANTSDKVFIRISLNLIDVIEEIVIPITV
ncbi:phage tail sheath subtilisin-like domain-containing protein [Ihubacter massiliensis]|uniref:phage tail sheath subtilisin-like domain-containing protein n=1 Tax=Ihubacter massiliensis TaxID=1852367 RepID=UPI002097610C|nr:phage tail sheath subtilisin-like domain-containing protein [Ihubacter massiliensis]MCI7301321.1 phage tail sheath subtilisin-like domain-containing protein [Clostridia bacterium]MCO7120593.1 phage tail sheath subtilisin-like domain-containing protein [Ihubacter massiliensis]MDY3010599.1 phage tail sheath subtilisin-like domain-containing protein [Clostridiales Family XIII bacterium]